MEVAASRGKLGSIDTNRNEMLLGWDTDMFPTDPVLATYTMKRVMEQGGLAPGGLNFDAKVRRESVDVEDLFIGHINGMDNYARGLLSAAKMIEEGQIDRMVDARYADMVSTPLGQKISDGTATLEEMAAFAAEHGEPENRSGKQEAIESISAWSDWKSRWCRSGLPRAPTTASEGLRLPSTLVRRGRARPVPRTVRGPPARGHSCQVATFAVFDLTGIFNSFAYE